MPPTVAAPQPASIAPPLATAAEQARRNWGRNIQAIRDAQPDLAVLLDDIRVDDAVEWIFGRDGFLTAFVHADEWWTGCSVPLAAARMMLGKLEVSGVVACFLEPTHAAHVCAALDKLRPQQAVIVVQPDASDLAIALHCHDFANAIAAGRLWFAAGEAWANALHNLFGTHWGLPTPSSFIRLPTAEPARIDELVVEAQAVFANVNRTRADAMHRLRQSWAAPPAGIRRIGLIVPSSFQLWNDAAGVLAETLSADDSQTWLRLDPHHPTTASPVALAEFAVDVDAIVSADLSRVDAPHTLADGIPWVTWITTGRVPPASSAGPNDRLLLADEAWLDVAVGAGWSRDRLSVAGWPAVPAEDLGFDSPGDGIWIIEDTLPIEGDATLDEFSSHRLLWEAIESELRRDSLSAGNDPGAFLTARMSQLGVGEQGLDRRRFIDRLILPATQQGVARFLLRAGLPLRLAGRGWDLLDDLRTVATGPVESREHLTDLVRAAGVIVRTCSRKEPHPLDGCRRPVIASAGCKANALVQAIRQVVQRGVGHANSGSNGVSPLSATIVARLLDRT